ncbi:rho guanine nucleotide exchange factor 15 [Betta splendens]|uniref:Rho guanine nucleotide exchange factor 15 n=1 Tax=Betta splendens TaxID=158456 RepID=A0A6P7LKL4_BETSP|nr:rho guanine nucleotide exchange factor 15 [Betta splendens]
MSVEEPTPPSFLKLEAKSKPDIPPKPPTQSAHPSPEDGDGGARGKVKRIVHKFSLQDSVSEEHPATEAADAAQSKRLKSPPPVKPKPSRVSQQLQAPPLPAKTRGTLQKQKECVQGGGAEGVGAAGRRSAPDGKEVEVLPVGGGEAEAEHGAGPAQSPCCEPGCSCMCHRHRPGMKLVWVPVDAEEEEREDETSEGSQKGEDGGDLEESDEFEDGEETGDEVDMTSVSEESQLVNQDKAKFHQSLDILISETQRRRSDPGPHAVFNSLGITRSHSPPVPPKRTQSPCVNQKPNDDEEESIYELVLQVINPAPKKEVEPPLVKVRMPARRSKLASAPPEHMNSSTEPASGLTEAPPAIPPRMPTAPDTHSHNPVHRGGIALPQPTLEEWRALLPSSHSSPPAPVPTGSPLVPHRPPPPPPNSRRVSTASSQYLTLKKDGDENGESEGEKEADETTLRRGSILNWQSRLQDEPLYQTYRATVIHKEIKRQTVCRNISKASGDFSVDVTSLRIGNGNGTLPGKVSPVPSAAQSTLWQDLPAVRDSGVLETLTSDQCKYQESMFEVLTSEASYLRSLRILIEHFMENRDLDETLIIMDKKTLFSNILKIREVSESFLKDLEERIFQEVVFSDICDIIFYHAQHKFHAFIDYVRNQIYQDQTFSTLMKSNPQFASVIARLQESPQCQRLPFMSFLLLPFQRITRIKMLVENILKRTNEKTNSELMVSKALGAVSKIIDECNTEVGKMRRMEELIQVSKMLEFDKLKAIPLVSQTRFLEKKGEMQEMSKGGTIFNMKAKFNPIHLFLFNDLLIVAVKKSAERFVVVDHAHRSLVQVQPVELSGGGGGCEQLFNLTLLENHQGRMMERLIKVPTQSDMHRWMAMFPSPTNPDAQDNEVIYEDWDCPQVQCLEQYVAQQGDELNLEPTDIVNVIRKSNEGWYEGSRLSDGQKGWFPSANVVEITNEHVRRRNIRERYRVIQAASLVTNKMGSAQ